MKKTLQIDLGALDSPDDVRHLRNVLAAAPDGVRRFCVSALYPDDPVLSRLVDDIHDLEATEAFLLAACKQLLSDNTFAQVAGLPILDNWHFGFWLSRLVRLHAHILPDGALRTAMLRAREEVGCNGNCRDCPSHKPDQQLN